MDKSQKEEKRPDKSSVSDKGGAYQNLVCCKAFSNGIHIPQILCKWKNTCWSNISCKAIYTLMYMCENIIEH